MLPQPINIKTIVSEATDEPTTYVIADNDNILNVDTSQGPLYLYLPNINGSGIISNPRMISINDIGGFLAQYPVTIFTTGEDTIFGNPSIVLDVNLMSVQCFACGLNKWTVNDLGLKLPIESTFATADCDAMTFMIDQIYGNIEEPCTNDIGYSELDTAKLGVTNLVIHNSPIEPNISVFFIILNGAYVTDVNNFIYVSYIGNNRFLCTISQDQD